MKKYLYKDLYDLEEKHWWHISKRNVVQELISHYSKIKNRKLLDIGCGTGKNIEVFGKMSQSWGIDSSKEAIKFCQKRCLGNVKWGSSENLPFTNSLFDVVTLLDVLEHTDEEKTLSEIHRVLKQKGIVIINVPAFPWLWSKWDKVLHHKKRYNKADLTKVLQRHGFKIKRISFMYSFLVIPTLLIRSIKSRVSKDNYSSDFKVGSTPINYFLLLISSLEKKIILKKGLPLGTSLICVAEKVTPYS